MVEVIYRNTTKKQRFVLCLHYVYFRKAENSNSIRYTCKNCDGSLTIANVTDKIIRDNGEKVDFDEDVSLEEQILSSHRNCEHEKMDNEELLAFDALNRQVFIN
jgi:hypothetical protein